MHKCVHEHDQETRGEKLICVQHCVPVQFEIYCLQLDAVILQHGNSKSFKGT
jgi:hypothetical protein